MIEVSKEEFFRAVGGPEDIHPRSLPTHSEWRNQRTHEIVGLTEPGYLAGSTARSRYALSPGFAAIKGIEVRK